MKGETTRAAAVCLMTLSLLLWLAGCATEEPTVLRASETAAARLSREMPAYPAVRMLVMADPHVYDPSLGTTGGAFQEYLLQDRKMLVESAELLEETVRRMSRESADFVLVPGDLTKDGERLSHELVAGRLALLEEAGLPAYVLPGNHDIANPHAYRYSGEEKEPVESVTAEQFRDIYHRFGFDEAVAEDPFSLSYVAEPAPGLWLFALDCCLYAENVDHPVAGGRFSAGTLAWITAMLEQAAAGGRAVIAAMHHGILEHYQGQKEFHCEYVIDDYQAVSRLFAEYGVRLVFTGHYHAQDVTVGRWDTEAGPRFLFDIETGSLVTPPNPFRVVQITADQRAIVESRFIDSIPSRPSGFPAYAEDYLAAGLEELVFQTVRGYKVSRRSARIVAPQVAAAIRAHYAGDETPPAELLELKGVGPWGRIVVRTQRCFLEGLWNDLEPPDNELVIDLKEGTWEPK